MEILESALRAIPGLALVFAIAALLMLPNDSEVAETIRVFVVAWSLYRIGSCLDWFFDRLYGPGPRRELQAKTKAQSVWSKGFRRVKKFWGTLRTRVLPGFKRLENSRDGAAMRLGQGIAGLYKAAAKKVEQEKPRDWKSKVSPLIDRSKAARAFILPFLLLSIAVATPAGDRPIPEWLLARFASFVKLPLIAPFADDFESAKKKLEFLQYPLVVALPVKSVLVCLVATYFYVSLRLRHMTTLYDLVPDRNAKAPGNVGSPTTR